MELKQSNRVLKVPADRTLLDIVRDTILSKADREKNETMMLCVGRSKTPLLVLDA